MAMYAAKTAGRAGVRVFDTAMHTRAVQRLDFEAALRRAVIRQQFTVRYQPVVELADGRLAGEIHDPTPQNVLASLTKLGVG